MSFLANDNEVCQLGSLRKRSINSMVYGCKFSKRAKSFGEATDGTKAVIETARRVLAAGV